MPFPAFDGRPTFACSPRGRSRRYLPARIDGKCAKIVRDLKPCLPPEDISSIPAFVSAGPPRCRPPPPDTSSSTASRQ